jgi:Na+-transporting NADH:ubiquinone oxidoreductase subunit A
MAKVIKTKKGLDIRMAGVAAKEYGQVSQAANIGFNPDDFYGITPKPIAKVGDKVEIGSVLFIDKKNPMFKVVSPVSGVVSAINRGERRKILDIVVANDLKATQATLPAVNWSGNVDEIKEGLSNAGMFAFFKQRPYDVMANPADSPRAIFISAFDKAPLAPDMNFILSQESANFQAAINVLAKIAPVYVGVDKNATWAASLQNAEVTCFDGAYPVSNVGVQINQLAPINRGEIVWTIAPQEVVIMGRYIAKGVLDFSKTVALVGENVVAPKYYKVTMGSPVAALTRANLSQGVASRLVAGNPLSGMQTTAESWLNPMVSQLTVLPEGDQIHEMLGWIMPRFSMFSLNGSFLSGLCSCMRKNKTFHFDTRILGGERHMIMSGEYDKVFPMDIYPEFLLKAIIAGDIDKMEALGIYEVAPEDFAAAEFVCSSKMELQKIVRKGLDLLRKEMC